MEVSTHRLRKKILHRRPLLSKIKVPSLAQPDPALDRRAAQGPPQAFTCYIKKTYDGILTQKKIRRSYDENEESITFFKKFVHKNTIRNLKVKKRWGHVSNKHQHNQINKLTYT